MRYGIGLAMIAVSPFAALAMGIAAYAAEPSGVVYVAAKELGPQIAAPAWFLVGAWLTK
jgi:hypothetical protein